MAQVITPHVDTAMDSDAVMSVDTMLERMFGDTLSTPFRSPCRGWDDRAMGWSCWHMQYPP